MTIGEYSKINKTMQLLKIGNHIYFLVESISISP